jgi:hydrogenase/urease accessory protein HupE
VEALSAIGPCASNPAGCRKQALLGNEIKDRTNTPAQSGRMYSCRLWMEEMSWLSTWNSWRAEIRDPALSALLLIECLLIFIVAPWAGMEFPGSEVVIETTLFIFGLLVVLISNGKLARTVAILAVLFTLAGVQLTFVLPSSSTRMLSYIGSLGCSIVASYSVGRAVFAPGVVNAHRVRGAVVLYLNFGIIFLTGYRLIWDLVPNAIGGVPSGVESWKATSALLYFSFVTLTSVGFGDIVPVHPLARSLANLESIIGQLYPATLLARLITLELEARRR